MLLTAKKNTINVSFRQDSSVSTAGPSAGAVAVCKAFNYQPKNSQK